jgi:propanol-preferring alcohol dehydrogenase
VAEVAQQPPQPRRAAVALVVGHHGRVGPDPGAPGRRGERIRVGERMAAAFTGRRREIRVHVHVRRAGDVGGEVRGAAGARLGERPAAVHHHDLAESLGEPLRADHGHGGQYVAMRAMVLDTPGEPLRERDLPDPEPGAGQLALEVHACAVCRTDLHVVDGELTEPKLPLVPGHQIVGTALSDGERFAAGDRVGVPWLGWTCGRCRYCTSGRENLCEQARFTGYDLDGGYAERAVADERFCFPIPDGFPDLQAAPLLCAGLIGFRALRMTGDAERLGLYGFGAAAHIVAQVARSQGRRVFAFTRGDDEAAQAFARELGAEWAGDSLGPGPEELDAAIVFAPVGALVPAALRATARGGTVVCAGIHMSDIPAFPYELLWGERVLRSVANLTRADGDEFMRLAPEVPVRTEVEAFPLERANEALDRLRSGDVRGAAVLQLRE